MLSRIQNENDLAKSMLEEIIANPNIKIYLQDIATQSIHSILRPFLDTVLAQNDQSFEDYPQHLKKALNYLADKHVQAEMQFGALMPELNHKEAITHSKTMTVELFNRIETCLSHVSEISTMNELLSVMKCLADLGWCYFECLEDLHQKDYPTIKNMIWPTSEEFFDARIRQDETGQETVTANSFGIGKQLGTDLIPAKLGLGWEAGKSIFAGVSMAQRIDLLVQRFDKKLSELRDAIVVRDQDPTEMFTKQDENIKKLRTEVDSLRLKMQSFHIPLDKNARLPLSYYAKKYQTTFEKLAHLPLAKHEQPMPLIASVSGSSARTLIALQDVNAFVNEQGQYDFDKMQIISNCLAAFYVHCGHHSWLEVAEVHNRLLDHIVIHDGGAKHLLDDSKNNLPYMNNPMKLEEKLPYFHIGDYSSFLHGVFAVHLPMADYAKPSACFRL